jgi:hypothetical protein
VRSCHIMTYQIGQGDEPFSDLVTLSNPCSMLEFRISMLPLCLLTDSVGAKLAH